MRALDPSLILHVRWLWMRGSAYNRAFHADEIPVLFQPGSWIQSMTCKGHMYLWYEIDDQRFCLVSKVHPIFAAKACAKYDRSFRPQPTHFLGIAMLSQLIHAKTRVSCPPFQRYLQHICLRWASIPLGIHAKAIQNTGVASNTDLMSTNVPALDRKRWLQCEILFSNLEIS